LNFEIGVLNIQFSARTPGEEAKEYFRLSWSISRLFFYLRAFKLHDSEANQDITIVFDGLKIQFEQEYMKAEDSDKVDHELEMDDLYDEDFGFRLAEMVRKGGEKWRLSNVSSTAPTAF
jgi:hypothetical protein